MSSIQKFQNPRAQIGALSMLCALSLSPSAQAQSGSSEEDLVKATANPVAAMISLPLQSNWERGFGPDNKLRYTLNVQPVIPVKLNDDWNLVTRTIVPVVHMPALETGQSDTWGISDTTLSLLVSPSKVSRLIWAAGGVFLLPTASADVLASKKFGLGPSAVVLIQEGPWTYGGLANHIWSVAGSDSRPKINQTYFNPFLTYAFGGGWSGTLQAEFTQNWEAESGKQSTAVWTPVVSKLLKIEGQALSVGVGYRHYTNTPNGSPDNGLRLVFNFLFPR